MSRLGMQRRTLLCHEDLALIANRLQLPWAC